MMQLRRVLNLKDLDKLYADKLIGSGTYSTGKFASVVIATKSGLPCFSAHNIISINKEDD